MGQFEEPLLSPFPSTREGSVGVTEEFAFQKIILEGGAVHGYEGLPGPGAGVMNTLGEEFFSRAGFAHQKNVGIVLRVETGDLFRFLDNRAASDDIVESILRGVPAAEHQPPNFPLHLLDLGDILEGENGPEYLPVQSQINLVDTELKIVETQNLVEKLTVPFGCCFQLRFWKNRIDEDIFVLLLNVQSQNFPGGVVEHDNPVCLVYHDNPLVGRIDNRFVGLGFLFLDMVGPGDSEGLRNRMADGFPARFQEQRLQSSGCGVLRTLQSSENHPHPVFFSFINHGFHLYHCIGFQAVGADAQIQGLGNLTDTGEHIIGTDNPHRSRREV